MPDGELKQATPRVLLAGALVGPFCSIVSTPFERVKVQMVMDTARQFNNTAHAALTLARSGGIRSLYVGHGVNSARELTFLATYFGVFEHGKALLKPVLPASIAVPVAGRCNAAAA